MKFDIDRFRSFRSLGSKNQVESPLQQFCTALQTVTATIIHVGLIACCILRLFTILRIQLFVIIIYCTCKSIGRVGSIFACDRRVRASRVGKLVSRVTENENVVISRLPSDFGNTRDLFPLSYVSLSFCRPISLLSVTVFPKFHSFYRYTDSVPRVNPMAPLKLQPSSPQNSKQKIWRVYERSVDKSQ